MEVKLNSTIQKAIISVGDVHRKYTKSALVTALNKVGKEALSRAKEELAGATGLTQARANKGLTPSKAKQSDPEYSFKIKSRYLNIIEFKGKQTKKGVTDNAWGKRKLYRGSFIGSGRNSGKQLAFRRVKDSKRIEALHGASLPREFHRKDVMAILEKKIKTRFPILLKRAVEFQIMKARGRV